MFASIIWTVYYNRIRFKFATTIYWLLLLLFVFVTGDKISLLINRKKSLKHLFQERLDFSDFNVSQSIKEINIQCII